MRKQLIKKNTSDGKEAEGPVRRIDTVSQLKKSGMYTGKGEGRSSPLHYAATKNADYQLMADRYLQSHQGIGQFKSADEEPLQRKANTTGLPDQLKTGAEHLSGIDLSDVKVHYNSQAPAQLNAHAFAQGNQIHVAPGQEKHLPHEAWHVIQQKQGRVKPTTQLKDKVPVNDDKHLESEADVMGQKALIQGKDAVQRKVSTTVKQIDTETTAQLARTKATVRKTPGTTAVPRKQRTFSGHGALKRDTRGRKKFFKVPYGKIITRPAPRGATLGDISKYLNKNPVIDQRTIRDLIKISTTSELWSNKTMISKILNESSITKTSLQIKILTDLESGAKTYSSLTGPQKTSLTKLENNKTFEAWLETYIKPKTFQQFNGGENIEDMDLTAFESKLRSRNKTGNTYVNNPEVLSNLVNNCSDDDITVNACSYDPNEKYTGFQVDKL